jgi:hypothetical protein
MLKFATVLLIAVIALGVLYFVLLALVPFFYPVQ